MLQLLLAIALSAAAPALELRRDLASSAGDIVVIAPSGFPPDARRVPDAELAAMRGGMLLPNGLDVTLGIDIQTRVDGILQLHTLYLSSGPLAGVNVFRSGTKDTPYIPGATVMRTPGATAPSVVVDRSPTGTTVSSVSQVTPANVGIVAAPSATWPAVEGETPVPVTPDGQPVVQENGTYRLSTSEQGTVARFDTDTLSVQHLIGQATGAVILNSANNRVIDTTSTVAVDLGNFPVAAVAGALAMDGLALDAIRGR